MLLSSFLFSSPPSIPVGQSQMQMALHLLMGSTAARSGGVLGPGVLTSLLLHSSGHGRSYLSALIYDQDFSFF